MLYQPTIYSMRKGGLWLLRFYRMGFRHDCWTYSRMLSHCILLMTINLLTTRCIQPQVNASIDLEAACSVIKLSVKRFSTFPLKFIKKLYQILKSQLRCYFRSYFSFKAYIYALYPSSYYYTNL